jgi:hypothetical protein
MTAGDLLDRIANEYDLDHGFIGKVRSGQFDKQALERLLRLLRECPSASQEPMDARMVRLLWWMPWIVEWQVQRLTAEGRPADQLRAAQTAIFGELERILGVA